MKMSMKSGVEEGISMKRRADDSRAGMPVRSLAAGQEVLRALFPLPTTCSMSLPQLSFLA